jgi:hypothetical protein
MKNLSSHFQYRINGRIPNGIESWEIVSSPATAYQLSFQAFEVGKAARSEFSFNIAPSNSVVYFHNAQTAAIKRPLKPS